MNGHSIRRELVEGGEAAYRRLANLHKEKTQTQNDIKRLDGQIALVADRGRDEVIMPGIMKSADPRAAESLKRLQEEFKGLRAQLHEKDRELATQKQNLERNFVLVGQGAWQ